MKVFGVITLLASLALVQGGYHSHHVVTPDIIHHVSKVLGHEYGSHVVLGYPEKAHLVDYGVTTYQEPHYGHHDHYGGHHGGHHGGHYSVGLYSGGGHGHGHHAGSGHGHHAGSGHGHYGGGHRHHYVVPAYLGYAGTGHEHYHGHGHY